LINKLKKATWRSPSGANIVKLVDIVQRIKSNPRLVVHVGTDSHKRKGVTDSSHIFATVICLYEPGKGATYYFKRIIDPTKYKSLNQRLMAEASLSINTSISLTEYISISRIVVHSDTNSDSRFASFKSTEVIRSWVKAMGFEFKCKPDAWASSSVADWHAK
jgi:predicted RNase H-related nuclease YkuK (DUF458 family)